MLDTALNMLTGKGTLQLQHGRSNLTLARQNVFPRQRIYCRGHHSVRSSEAGAQHGQLFHQVQLSIRSNIYVSTRGHTNAVNQRFASMR